MIAWHYTVADQFESILVDHAIIPATAGVDTSREKPAVWFSRRETWEPTATKGMLDRTTGHRRDATPEEMHEFGMVRIGVDASGLTPWLVHRNKSGITARVASSLVTSAVAVGSNPGDWFVSYEPVPRERWLRVERWDGAEWVDLEQEKTS